MFTIIQNKTADQNRKRHQCYFNSIFSSSSSAYEKVLNKYGRIDRKHDLMLKYILRASNIYYLIIKLYYMYIWFYIIFQIGIKYKKKEVII